VILLASKYNYIHSLPLGGAIHYFINNYGPEIFDGLLKDELSTRIAEMLTDDIVNRFIYNIPQFVPYLKH